MMCIGIILKLVWNGIHLLFKVTFDLKLYSRILLWNGIHLCVQGSSIGNQTSRFLIENDVYRNHS